ncbi:MAG: aspartate 1-decarboxylase [Tannerellaceae bacterium]|nr:aspartate 1-decarboxylase [Tannerellaceae bacterium]
MYIEVVKSKIHRVTVTEANLNYIGSITVDEDLLDAANLIANEKVSIVNNNNGERFETYIIKGERGSGVVCLNGAAARRVQPGDVIIIMSYALMDFEEAKGFKPAIIFPDTATNKLIKQESRRVSQINFYIDSSPVLNCPPKVGH